MRPAIIACVVALAACTDDRPRPTGGGDLAYPRIASYRIGSAMGTTLDGEREILERVSLAVVAAEAGVLERDALVALRARSPRLELLAHVAAVSIPRDDNPAAQPLATARFAKIPAGAWLLEPGSTTVGGTSAAETRIRVANPAAFAVVEPTYLIVGDEHVKLVAIEGDELVVERGYRSAAAMHAAGSPIAAHATIGSSWKLDVMTGMWRDLIVAEAAALVSDGIWTGVSLDVCQPDAGFGELVAALRAQLGDDVALVANAGLDDCAHDALDGILLEGFPIGPQPDRLPFDVGFERYARWTSRAEHPSLSIANAFSPAIGLGTIAAGQEEMARTDYSAMRFGLATALMGDGYYTFDDGVLGHNAAWWYDELDGAGRGAGWLGHPQGPPTRVSGGAYVRTFTKGMVIANPTATPLAVVVPPGFRTIAGTQDPEHNDDTEVAGSLIVAGMDGFVLAR